jgi:hypothetical protein
MEDRSIGVLCKKKALQNYKYRDKLSRQTNNVPKHSGCDESVERLQRLMVTNSANENDGLMNMGNPEYR